MSWLGPFWRRLRNGAWRFILVGHRFCGNTCRSGDSFHRFGPSRLSSCFLVSIRYHPLRLIGLVEPVAGPLIRWHIGDCASINLAIPFVSLLAALQTNAAYPISAPPATPVTKPLSHRSALFRSSTSSFWSR